MHPGFYEFYPEAQYLDAWTQRAAHEYAFAHARVQAMHRRRQHYQQHSAERRSYPTRYPFAYVNSQPGFGVEDFADSVWREEQHRRAVRAREQGLQFARVLAGAAAAREEAAHRERARAYARARAHAHLQAQAQRASELETLWSLLGAAASFMPSQSSPQPAQAYQESSPLPPTQTVPETESAPVDRKGKGKVVETPAGSSSASVSSAMSPPDNVPSFREELEARIRTETDPEVQESLLLLYTDIFDAPQRSTASVPGPSMSKKERSEAPTTEFRASSSFQVPVEGSSPGLSPATTAATVPVPEASVPATEHDDVPRQNTGANLHRTPAVSPAIAAKLRRLFRARHARRLSLTQIAEVEDALRKLEFAFEFPDHVDFVDVPEPGADAATSDTDSALAYTLNNTPIHAYEHTLNQLLVKLDGIESNGDDEVRGRRREVVKEVERALEAMDRRLEESRERERERERSREREGQVLVGDDGVEKEVISAEDAVIYRTAIAPTVEEQSSQEDTTSVDASTVVANETTPYRQASTTIVEGGRSPALVPEALNLSQTSYPEAAANVSEVLDATAPVHDDLDRESLATQEHGISQTTKEEASDSVDEDDGLSQSHVLEPIPEEGPSSTSTGSDNPVHLEPSEFPLAPVAFGDASTQAANIETVNDAASPITSTVPTLAPEVQAISRVASSATDGTFATAESEFEPTADANLSTSEAPTQVSAEPMSPAPSSGGGEGTFLLLSTPLSYDEPKKRPAVSDESDELEIISKEELEAARNDSDWSDVESNA